MRPSLIIIACGILFVVLSKIGTYELKNYELSPKEKKDRIIHYICVTIVIAGIIVTFLTLILLVFLFIRNIISP